MNDYAEIGRLNALLAIVAGLLLCFWGYRLLKLSLALVGFVAGAFAGWEVGLALANSSTAMTVGCAVVGGILGMALCLWLYFFGIFLLGATAGVVVAAAFFSGVGHQVQPIVFLVLPIAFGAFALVVQKFMVVLSTAFSGAYMIMAGIWPFIVEHPDVSRIWLYPGRTGAPGNVGYGALALWALLIVLGIGSQLRAGHPKAEPEVKKEVVQHPHTPNG